MREKERGWEGGGGDRKEGGRSDRKEGGRSDRKEGGKSDRKERGRSDRGQVLIQWSHTLAGCVKSRCDIDRLAEVHSLFL